MFLSSFRQRHTGKTPPPYTPPPILSPIRSGTGLFYSLYHRQQSANGGGLSASLPAGRLSTQLRREESIAEESEASLDVVKTDSVSASMSSEHSPVARVTAAISKTDLQPEVQRQPFEEPQVAEAESHEMKSQGSNEEEAPPPLETDIQPHINIGPGHQAALPTLMSKSAALCCLEWQFTVAGGFISLLLFIERGAELDRTEHKASLMWSPDCLRNNNIKSDECEYH